MTFYKSMMAFSESSMVTRKNPKTKPQRLLLLINMNTFLPATPIILHSPHTPLLQLLCNPKAASPHQYEYFSSSNSNNSSLPSYTPSSASLQQLYYYQYLQQYGVAPFSGSTASSDSNSSNSSSSSSSLLALRESDEKFDSTLASVSNALEGTRSYSSMLKNSGSNISAHSLSSNNNSNNDLSSLLSDRHNHRKDSNAKSMAYLEEITDNESGSHLTNHSSSRESPSTSSTIGPSKAVAAIIQNTPCVNQNDYCDMQGPEFETFDSILHGTNREEDPVMIEYMCRDSATNPQLAVGTVSSPLPSPSLSDRVSSSVTRPSGETVDADSSSSSSDFSFSSSSASSSSSSTSISLPQAVCVGKRRVPSLSLVGRNNLFTPYREPRLVKH
eukprot:TRINITY_DN2927_c0_g1_i1.p1 TRINITY_DN2927_c0_g1~~TRINITY_DN2927_c0_g1_i1.p1  ORF type:complete len:386 (+),score=89.04 TRINITY_DN2927_c0_g1_i1:488-1645(+)